MGTNCTHGQFISERFYITMTSVSLLDLCDYKARDNEYSENMSAHK